MLTRIPQTLVRLHVTAETLETALAQTVEPVDAINTGAAVDTRAAVTFVDVGSTDVVVVARWTGALELVLKVSTGSSVTARVRQAFVDVYLTT